MKEEIPENFRTSPDFEEWFEEEDAVSAVLALANPTPRGVLGALAVAYCGAGISLDETINQLRAAWEHAPAAVHRVTGLNNV